MVVVVVDVVVLVGVSIVVDVVVLVGVSIVVDVVVLVVVPQSQLSRLGLPTATLRQVSASVALGFPPDALRSQMHTGSQVLDPTAARKMKRQSVAVGKSPLLTGCPQSSWAATETFGSAATSSANASAAEPAANFWS